MNNYQLYRTNILLGGQMKWDLVLDSGIGGLYVDDFHLSPISNRVPFNYKKEEDLLNYSHEKNIRRYYKENSGYFYQNIISPTLDDDWMDWPTGSINYNDTVDMGCSRPYNYSIYKKQFQVFVPVWLENVTDDLSFIISIYSPKDQLISSKSLVIKEIGESNSYHNRFVKYFKDFIKYIDLNDDVINIDLKGNYANVHGLEVLSGNVVTKQDLFLINNLLHRERPLMENDNMIIQLFEKNHLIAKQLFNFNLCFNIEDIVSGILRDQIYGQSFKIKVETKIGDTILPIKDFYTNYEFIPKTIINGAAGDKANVLSYMSDYKSLDLINKNKIKSDVIHWSLKGNNDYIFNLYDGFSAAIKENNIINMSHRYDTTPDTNIYKYSAELNNINWVNHDDNFTLQKMIEIVRQYTVKMEELGSAFNHGWVNNLYYDNYIDGENKNTTLYFYLGICKPDELKSIKAIYKLINILDTSDGYLGFYYNKEFKNHILILTNNNNLVTFKRFTEIINNIDNLNSPIYKLNKFIDSLKPVPVIVFHNSLYVDKADSPDINSQEISYVTDNNCPINYIERYDGKIVPTFVDKNNFFYYRTKNEKFDTYKKLGYTPLYPSLNYFSIKYNENSNYTKPLFNNDKVEYKWFNDSKYLVLIPELKVNFEINEQSPSEDIVNTEIKNKLSEIYNIKDDNNKIEYIYNCYKYDIKYDYNISIDERSLKYNYKYEVKIILK